MITHFNFISQKEQLNDFWLIELRLLDPFELPFYFSLKLGSLKLFLFSQKEEKCFFLSKVSFNAQQIKTLQQKPHPLNKVQTFISFNENRPLFILASGLKIASAFCYVERLKRKNSTQALGVILHSNDLFPFQIKPATLILPNFPAHAIGACSLLEDWQVVNRLCSSKSSPGCFEGDFETLQTLWEPDKSWQICTL